MYFRNATQSDLEEMKILFCETIQSVCSKDYNDDQIAAWTSCVNDNQLWDEIIEHQFVLLAVIGDKIVGFGTLKNGNCIDFFYMHKDFQKQGIASQLLDELEAEARNLNAKKVISEISITAKSFFGSRGFTIVERQDEERNGTTLVNFKMEKQL